MNVSFAVFLVLGAVNLSGTLRGAHASEDKRTATRWFNAVCAHDLHAVDSLIRTGVDVDTRDKHGSTALMFAASMEWRDYKIIDLLLNAGANVNAIGSHGTSALRNTIGIGGAGQDTLLFRLLLDKGANAIASCPECCDRSVFLYACMWGTPEMVEQILRGNVNVNAADCRGRGALVYAIEGRNAAVVELLLGSGADEQAKDQKGRSPLDHAVRIGDRTILDLFNDRHR